MSAACNSGAASLRWPSTHIWPSPISDSVMWASGARSPDAPTDPMGRHPHGISPALWIAISVSTTCSRTPE